MNDALLRLYQEGRIVGDQHGGSSSVEINTGRPSVSSKSSGAEQSSAAGGVFLHHEPTRHEVLEFHEGDSRLPTRRRI